MEIREKYTETDPVDGSVHVVEKERHVALPSEQTELYALRVTNTVWYITSLLELLVGIRFVLLLFGANNTGFASFIYGASNPLVHLFDGIFRNPVVSGGTFESASLVALLVIMLIGWAIAGLIDLAMRPTVPTGTHQLR